MDFLLLLELTLYHALLIYLLLPFLHDSGMVLAILFLAGLVLLRLPMLSIHLLGLEAEVASTTFELLFPLGHNCEVVV